MPVPATGYYEVHASSVGAPVTVSLPPILIPANRDTRSHVMIAQTISAGNSDAWSASTYISQYVQDGTIHTGVFRELQGHNITEIILTANVLNASVVGTMLVEYF
jgi:hypothetical protein